VTTEGFGVSAPNFDIHTAHRILLTFAPYVLVIFGMMAMHHVCAAAQPHHEIEKTGKYQEGNHSLHN